MMEFKSIEFKETAFDTSKRTVEGYVSTWDQDQVGDIIHPGAFTKSIAEALPAKRIKMLWQHRDPLGMPIEMRQDDIGLYAKGRISRTQLGDDALELMRDGVVDRFSIGFMIPKGKATFDDEGVRHIHEVKLLEFSPVTFPANEAAVVTGVKSLREQLINVQDDEVKTEILKELNALAALFATPEPRSSTPSNEKPLDVTKAKCLLKELSDYAKNQ